MEYIKCSKCGNENPSIITRCRVCGERLTITQTEKEPKALKDRNDFVTFWLWLGIIVNSLLTIFWFAFLFSSRGLWDATPEPMSSRIATFVCSCLLTIGYIMLLNWLKSGFYLLVGVGIAESICFLLCGMTSGVVFAVLCPLVILYFVLQCSKSGKTCWEQLGYHIPKSDEVAQSDRNGFVSFWLNAGAAFSFLCIFIFALLLFDIFNLGNDTPILILMLTISVGCLVGYGLLIKGLRIGFYIVAPLLLIFGVNLAIQVNANQWIPITATVVAVLTLFAVLQIKKNGKSYWQLLS